MDARRYDRNADLLAQIYWHTNRLPDTIKGGFSNDQKQRLLSLIDEALKVNDALGQMAEKGLI